ncbi:MAG: hypothetical protein ACRC6I_09215, partial [Paracoccaceae bacterium]
MGRETEAQVQYGPDAGHARALLESDALILRGSIRARIPRAALHAPRVNADTLHITAPAGALSLMMPAGEAANWRRALEKPLPNLAEKLGLTGQKVWCLTPLDDEALTAALATATTASGPDATVVIAVLLGAPDLAQLI